MSAYIVDKRHIDHLVQAALVGCTDTEGRWDEYDALGWVYDRSYRRVYPPNDSRADGTRAEALTPSQLGQLLLNENVRSVEGRYPNTSVDAGNMPGPNSVYYYMPYVFEPVLHPDLLAGRLVRIGLAPALSITQLVNALRGYCYQSCESDDWLSTEAYAIVTSLREKLLAHIPGVDDADGWSLS